MSLLLVNDVRKHYAGREILAGATLQVDPGEKVGMVGRNGEGKTTLLRVIEGEETPDSGSLTLRKGARIGHVPQAPKFAPGQSVRSYVEGGLSEARDLAVELERVADRMAGLEGAALESAMKEHERVSERLELAGGWEIERRVQTVLSGIGLAEEFWDREAVTLSGGERSRTALARELVAGHDLLLLDEPTNHLDLEGIEWMESWLGELKGAVLIVSHDRRLLDRAVGAILELERGRVARYPGNYSQYVRVKAERYESDLRAWKQQQEDVSREENFIKKHMGSQRTAEAKGRQRKLENVERLERPYDDVRRPIIRPPKTARGGEMVVETEKLAGGYGKPLFEGVDLRIGRGQRVGVVGPNGAGKSTLLRLLSERQAPLAGRVLPGFRAMCGYYDQDTSGLDEGSTVYSELRREHLDKTESEIRGHLARFLFRGDDVEKPVKALSGGERARLALAKLMWTEVSWLAMDEPTNHLDLAARTALEEMLSAFEGALVCVSHDREFLDGLCTHVIEVADGGVRMIEGNYTTWRELRAAENDERMRARDAAKARDAQAARKAAAKGASGGKAAAEAAKVRNPYKFKQLEGRIIAFEEQLAALQEEIGREEVYRDANKLRDTQVRIAEVEAELEEMNELWANWD